MPAQFELQPGEAAYLERQRALLENMLRVTKEQRRCLIDGDLKGLEQTNQLLGSLLESQEELHKTGPLPEEPADHTLLSELRALAFQLHRESQTNYLLACRGAEFTRFSLSILSQPGDPAASLEGEGAPGAGVSGLVDRPA